MKLKNGKIKPAYGISDLLLGMSYQQIYQKYSGNFSIDPTYESRVIVLENAKLWFDEKDELCQIMVHGDFTGKVYDKIGVGSTLKDLEEEFGRYEYELGVFVVHRIRGICFEPEDNDEDDPGKRLIEYISVFAEF